MFEPEKHHTALPELKKVMSDLSNSNDVEGWAIIGTDGSIISLDLPDEINPEEAIWRIFRTLKQRGHIPCVNLTIGSFRQFTTDYNGFKVLATMINKDSIFVLVIRNLGYLSLAMLDLENSAREIARILSRKGISNRTFTSAFEAVYEQGECG